MEQGVQALKVALPESPVSLQPHFKFLERRWTQCINSALSVHTNVHQAGITEHPQMFGDLRLAQMQPMDHLPDYPRLTPWAAFLRRLAAGFGSGAGPGFGSGAAPGSVLARAPGSVLARADG
jgi:hypothetical protein